MTFNKTLSLTAASIASAFLISACGGGGGDDPTPIQTAQGAYAGTVTGSEFGTAFDLVVLENDEFWAFYGTRSGGALYIEGFVQGQGKSDNGKFTSSNAKDFWTYPALAANVNANYQVGTSIQGTLASDGSTSTFDGTSIPAATFDYNAAANLNQIAGPWALTSDDGDAVQMNIDAKGAFSGLFDDCPFSGSMTPRASGKNVFNFSVSFDASCEYPAATSAGIAITTPLTNGQRQLTIAFTDPGRTLGYALFGTR